MQKPPDTDMAVSHGTGKAGWRLYECGEAASTNDLARGLPAWSAVRADSQCAGRGRFGRRFVSDPGGLWISAVLPAEGGMHKWAGFSLMAGLHLLKMLEALPVPGARLRWPNDLMAGPKKLAGLLIEQVADDELVVGIGLNVLNVPWHSDPELAATATNLSLASAEEHTVREMAVLTLDALAEAHEEMEVGGMQAAIKQLNTRWSRPSPVRLLLTGGGSSEGRFAGLDPSGNLRILDDLACEFFVAHQSIAKLIELE